MIEKLRHTLIHVRELAGPKFSGIGIVIHEPDVSLPIFPLRLRPAPLHDMSIEQSLAKIALVDSEYHDGFHLISTAWQITAIAQYFSPPIVPEIAVHRERLFGGRYLAAQFGSVIDGVRLCGVASNGFGMAIFRSGREVHFERL